MQDTHPVVHLKSLFYSKEMTHVEKRCREAYTKHGISTVIWNTTRQCGLNCTHCYIGDTQDTTGELNTSEVASFLAQLHEMGVPLIFLTGGEPLLRKDIFEILKLCNDYQITTVLSSNGLLLNDQKIDALLSYNVHYIALSLYGPAAQHDSIVGLPQSHDKIIENAQKCIQKGIKVAFKTVVSSYTYDNVPYIIEKGLSLGVKAFYLCDLIETGRAENAKFWRISPEQWGTLAEYLFDKVIVKGEAEIDIGACPSLAPLAVEYFKAKGYDIAHAIQRLSSMSACPVGQGPISVSAKGDILPCNFMQQFKLGNVRQNDLAKLKENQLLKSIATKTNLKGKCGSCQYKKLCCGCRAKAYLTNKDIEDQDTTCILAANTPK
ncbi:MAG: radical SAM protein [Candidatus Bathyarchaeota archaeon]|nr:radical SAM protein [Candidatus Bathyarchaeota archaeon]